MHKHKHQYIVATFIYLVCIVGRVDCVGAQEGFHKVDQRLLQTPFSGEYNHYMMYVRNFETVFQFWGFY